MSNRMAKLTMALLLGINSATIAAEEFFNGAPADSDTGGKTCETDCEANWEASVEFGYVAVSGNTDTNTVNGRFALSYEIEKWRHAGFISGNTSSSQDNVSGLETDSEKYVAQLKSDYKYSDKAYAFGIVDYDDTKDSGFDYQMSYAFGGGYRFLNDKVHKLDAELGVGTRKSKLEMTGVTNSETIVRLAGLYKWKISKTAGFEQKLSTEIGNDNTITKSYSGLSAKLVDDLAMKLSYTIKHQSDVPVNTEDTETITSFTIVYSF